MYSSVFVALSQKKIFNDVSPPPRNCWFQPRDLLFCIFCKRNVFLYAFVTILKAALRFNCVESVSKRTPALFCTFFFVSSRHLQWFFTSKGPLVPFDRNPSNAIHFSAIYSVKDWDRAHSLESDRSANKRRGGGGVGKRKVDQNRCNLNRVR